MPFSSDVFADADLISLAQQLCDHTYAVLPNRCARPQQAWAAAGLVIATAAAEDPLCRTLSPLHVVADYKLPLTRIVEAADESEQLPATSAARFRAVPSSTRSRPN
jgi:hypothetical protein